MVALTLLQVLACIILVGFILLQPAPKSGNAFGPSDQSLTGQSAGTSGPFKITMFAAAFLAVSSLYMSWAQINENSSSVIDQLEMPLDAGLGPDLSTQEAPALGGDTTDSAAESEGAEDN